MTSPTHEMGRTITVSVYSPLILGGGFIWSLDEEIDKYTHTISVEGGFTSAEITLKTRESVADEWLCNGLGRHIVTRGPGGETAWEGYVDGVSVNLGSISVERGKLQDICNRCCVQYAPITGYDDETGEPEVGTTTETLIAENMDSQYRYGIWEQVVAGGTLDENADPDDPAMQATQLRDTYLEDNKDPETSHNPVLGGEAGSDITVTLSCRGYYDWLKNYVYNYGEANVWVELSEKIIDVLAEDPNNIFSTDTSFIDFNATLTNSLENTNRTAISIITEIVSFGDVFDSRWMLGVYDKRIVQYRAVPTKVEYVHYVGSSNQRILTLDQAEILPWNVRPGKFCKMPDLLLGRLPNYSELRLDQRIMFIEEVVFTAPTSLEIQGKKIRDLDQYLAKLGV